jgi:uncharacterized damage-inducible protein DinB
MSEEKARPYVHLLEGRDPVEVLRTTPARLAKVLTALTPEQIEFKPAPHKWSIREILCHLADCEVAWAWRLRAVYGAENPDLQPFEQDAWARAYGDAAYTTEAARAVWQPLRRWNLALIEGLSETDKQRPATHPELGNITLWNIVEIAAGHDLHHLNSLEKIAAAKGSFE